MSQTVCLCEINNCFYPEILSSLPDREEVIALIMELLEDGSILESDVYEVRTEWYEIGMGESGTDEFFTKEEILERINGNLPKDGGECLMEMARAAGHEVELITYDWKILEHEELEKGEW